MPREYKPRVPTPPGWREKVYAIAERQDSEAKHPDEIEAVRLILKTLAPFVEADRKRISAWAFERLAMLPNEEETD